MTVIEAQELYRFFHVGDEEIKALRGVDFSLSAGEFVALVGPSGSGKSTLLLCLAGIDDPDGGRVTVKGMPMSRRRERDKSQLRAAHMGIMQQKNNLFAHLTIAENMALAQGITSSPDAGAALGILDRIGMADRADLLPAQLSGGERARAGLAVALASEPSILILDEPTGEVDAGTEARIVAVLGEFCANGGAIVAATHNPQIATTATRTLRMRDGRISDV